MADEPVRIDLPTPGYSLFRGYDPHRYQRVNKKGKPGVRYTSVTGVLKAWPGSPDGLMRWAVGLTYAGVSRYAREYPVPSDPEELARALKEHGLSWEEIRNAAGTRGTNVHVRTLHALARAEEIPSLADLAPAHQGFGQGVMRFWSDRQPDPVAAEQAVLSLEHEYAGTFDLLAYIDGELVLVDLKTSRRIRQEHHVQLPGYKLAAVECGFPRPDRMVIVHVDGEGNYTEHDCQATEADFLAALQLHRRAGALRKKIEKAEKERVA